MFDRIEKDNKVAYYLNKDNPLIKQLQDNLSDADIVIFSALLKQIEEHLPLDSIQYDLASNKEIEENEDTDDEVYEEIMLLLNNQTTEKGKKLLLNSLKYSEVYLKKNSLIGQNRA